MTRSDRSLDAARARDERIRAFAYWARRHIVIRTNRSEREQLFADAQMEEALAKLRPADLRVLKP